MDLGLSFLAPIAESQRIDQAKEMQPADLAHKAATTRMLNAESSAMEVKAEQDRKAAALMAARAGQTGPSADQTISGKLLDLSKVWAEAGSPVKAEEALKASSAAAAHEATTQAAGERQAAAKLAAQQKQGQFVAQLLSGVQDQAGWDRANLAFKEATGKESPFAKYPYDPKMVETLANGAMSLKDRAGLAIKLRNQASLEAAREARAAHQKVQETLAERRLTLQKERADRLGKAGGKDVGAPAKGEIDAAKSLIAQSPGLVSASDLGVAAFDVAAQARALRKSNPGLSADEALRQALQTKKDSGDFQSGTPAKTFLGINLGGGKPAAYTVAKPLPASGSVADLVPGQHYRNAAGKVMEWSATGWKPASGKSAAPPPPDDSSDDGEDDDE